MRQRLVFMGRFAVGACVYLCAYACGGDASPGGAGRATDSASSSADVDAGADTDTDTAAPSTADSGSETGSSTIEVPLRLLSYNIGNPNADEPHYPLRLSSRAYEDHLAGVIATLAPDVVLLQEVLSRKTCEAFTEADATKTCYGFGTEPQPAARILGPGYTVVCDGRDHVECLGVRTAFGTIVGLAPGAYLESGAETPALPLPGCIWADGACDDQHCDSESTVSAVTITTAFGPLRLVHMHPSAQVSAAISGDPCRSAQLEQVFAGDVPGEDGDALVAGFDRAIVAGDWNVGLEVYNPRTQWQGRADEVWHEHIGCDTCRFRDVDPKDGKGLRYSTTSAAPEFLASLGLPVAIDHVVVSAGITGACQVHDKGGMPGTQPLDGAFPGLAALSAKNRIDHYALTCDLVLAPVGD